MRRGLSLFFLHFFMFRWNRTEFMRSFLFFPLVYLIHVKVMIMASVPLSVALETSNINIRPEH